MKSQRKKNTALIQQPLITDEAIIKESCTASQFKNYLKNAHKENGSNCETPSICSPLNCSSKKEIN